MREILYKAKRITDGEWVYGSYVYIFCEDKNGIVVGVEVGKHWIVEENGNMVWVDEDTICQYTGFNDMNGQKIWENDILCGNLDDMYPDDKTYAQVIWHKNGWYTKENGGIDYNLMDEFDEHFFAVVGNVFDNGDLTK